MTQFPLLDQVTFIVDLAIPRATKATLLCLFDCYRYKIPSAEVWQRLLTPWIQSPSPEKQVLKILDELQNLGFIEYSHTNRGLDFMICNLTIDGNGKDSGLDVLPEVGAEAETPEEEKVLNAIRALNRDSVEADSFLPLLKDRTKIPIIDLLQLLRQLEYEKWVSIRHYAAGGIVAELCEIRRLPRE